MRKNGFSRLLSAALCSGVVWLCPSASASPMSVSFSAAGFAVECEGSGPDPICQTTALTGLLRYVDPDPLSSNTVMLCDPANITLANPSGCAAGTSFHLTYGTPELAVPLGVSDTEAVQLRLQVIGFGNTIQVALDAVQCRFFNTDPALDPIGPGGCDGPFWRISGLDSFRYDSGHGEMASGRIGWIPEPPMLALVGIALASLLTTTRRRVSEPR